MKIITALNNEKINIKLKEKTNFEIICKDIQYQDGIIEVLQKNEKIDLIIISELLPGKLSFIEIINEIKKVNNKIEIIAILEKENEKTKNHLISKGIFNIFLNNQITIDELIKIIKEKNNIKKENEINEEIKKLKKIILENNRKNKKRIKNKKFNKKYFKIKNKILNKINFKNKLKIANNKNKIISIVGTNGIGKSIFSSILAKLTKNKKILLIDFDIFNQSINSIFNVKKTNKNNSNNLIIRANKNIALLCTVDFLFTEKYKIEKNKIKKFLEKNSSKYDLIIIDTTSECFFDYTKEILEKSDLIIFLAQANIVELKKSKNLLDIYINKWKISKDKINIIFNKEDKNSVDNKILKTLFSDFNILEKIRLNNKFDLVINNNLKIIDKKIKNKFEKIIEKCGL